ncbi:hypothetical protein [Streptomyces sp. NPDC050564]|uniref:hypothetical protein n=1 Tax=Streptomyces sp. NPDC050564 TaxID=3365631 RepID=UPI0037AE27F1
MREHNGRLESGSGNPERTGKPEQATELTRHLRESNQISYVFQEKTQRLSKESSCGLSDKVTGSVAERIRELQEVRKIREWAENCDPEEGLRDLWRREAAQSAPPPSSQDKGKN